MNRFLSLISYVLFREFKVNICKVNIIVLYLLINVFDIFWIYYKKFIIIE